MTEADKRIKQVLGTMGLAMKAGLLTSGEFMCEHSIRDGSARLIIVADDASAGTKKKFSDSCAYYSVPMICISDKETLGAALGKKERASIAILDDGFADKIRKKLTMEVS